MALATVLSLLASPIYLAACGDDTEEGMASAGTGGDGDGDGDGEPSCAEYCQTYMTNCADNSEYADMAACMTYCEDIAKWELGTAGATEGNSVACRTYHGGAPAMADPDTHCPHAGPSGGGVCGSYCDNYCELTAETCTGDNALHADAAACASACDGFADTGTPGDADGDTVQCRIYHGGAPAAGDPALHCPHAGVDGDGVCE